MIPWLTDDAPFPPVESALKDPNGLLAAGGELTTERLLAAYRRGIFPWYSAGQPVLWWSPDPRMVLFPPELKVSRSLARVVRNGNHEIRLDHDFAAVMQACAEPRRGQDGTWISAQMCAAYLRLHQLGYAHSVETWMDGELAGGLYGVAIGGMFYGESMFMRRRDASKIAMVHLVHQLEARGIKMIDCQMHTGHLASLGAREIPRTEFSQRLAELINYALPPGHWNTTRPVDVAA
ncbi:MAG: leucyl/phenylalanyl-tRNA--protein transferase [Betaproteobacteria bacterium]